MKSREQGLSALRQWILEEPLNPVALPESLLRKVVRDQIEPVTPLPSTAVLTLQISAMFVLFTLLAISLRGVAGWERMSLPQLAGMGAILAAGVGVVCASLAWQMIPGSRRLYLPQTAIAAPAGAFLLAVLLLFRWTEPDAFLASGLVCLGTGVLLSPVAYLLFRLYLRRGTVLDQGSATASLGAAAGLAGVSVLQFTCPHQDLAHLLAWHGGVLLLALSLPQVGAAIRNRF